MTKKAFLLSFLILTFLSCKEEVVPVDIIDDYSDIYNLPEIPFNYSNVQYPTTFTSYVFTFDNTPLDNQITDDGATLGRVLFYDKKLSLNETVSCASCHIQENGFSDPDVTSEGFNGERGRRNSMGIANAGFYAAEKFFWDHRAETLEDQVLMPFQDPKEMGMTLQGVVDKVAAQDYYKPLFENAFQSDEVTSDRISKALAQFVRSMASFSTEYDAGIEATGNIFVDFPNFTAQENLGKDIFNGKETPEVIASCVTCHLPNATPLHFASDIPEGANQVIFSGAETDNIGLVDTVDGMDNGEGEFFNIPSLYGHFKTGSIRNIELTAPYMHDGSLATLEDVVQHYSDGVKAHPNLSAHMKNGFGEPRHLDLTEEEAAALVAFMKTLTDHDLVTDVKFSDPFIE